MLVLHLLLSSRNPWAYLCLGYWSSLFESHFHVKHMLSHFDGICHLLVFFYFSIVRVTFTMPADSTQSPLLLSSSPFLNDTFLNCHHGTQTTGTWAKTLKCLNLFPHLKNLGKWVRMKLFSTAPNKEMLLIKILVSFYFMLKKLNCNPVFSVAVFLTPLCLQFQFCADRNTKHTINLVFTNFHMTPGMSLFF